MKRRTFLQHAAVAAAATAISRDALAAEEQVTTFKIATVAPDGTPWAEQLGRMRKRVDEGTQKKTRIKAHMGGALGDELTTIAETHRGTIHIWGGSTASVASVVPELNLFELPYLFRTAQECDHIIDNVLQDDITKALDKRGLSLVMWAENGFRSFGTTWGPVKKPEDLKGRKMRSQESDAHLDMYRAMGASPVPIPVTEVLSGLQTGAVEGFDNTPLFTFAASWHKGIKHYSLTEAIYQPGIVVANKKWWDALTPELRGMITGDAKQESKLGRQGVRDIGPMLVENFRTDKIAVHELTADERAVFAKLCEPVHEKWAKGKGKTAAPMLAKAKKALAELRKKT
jgi:TRAP-type transport system periplasmic protein